MSVDASPISKPLPRRCGTRHPDRTARNKLVRDQNVDSRKSRATPGWHRVAFVTLFRPDLYPMTAWLARMIATLSLAALAACATVPRPSPVPVEVGIIAINDFHGALEPPRQSVA